MIYLRTQLFAINYLLRPRELIKSLSKRKGWREEEGEELNWATGRQEAVIYL